MFDVGHADVRKQMQFSNAECVRRRYDTTITVQKRKERLVFEASRNKCLTLEEPRKAEEARRNRGRMHKLLSSEHFRYPCKRRDAYR